MLDIEKSIIKVLDSTEIGYEVIEIDPDFSDTTGFCSKYGYGAEQTCNTIIVVSKKG